MAIVNSRSKRRVAEWENEGGAMARDAPRGDRERPSQVQKGRNVMRTKTINAVVGAVCLVVGLALGSLAGAWYEGRSSSERIAALEAAAEASARDASSELSRQDAEISRLEARIDWLQIHLRLGRIAWEADHQDYGIAGERAARFFDDVALMAQSSNLDQGRRAVLDEVLAARDELIAGLATAQPSATQRLKELYLQLFDATSPEG